MADDAHWCLKIGQMISNDILKNNSENSIYEILKNEKAKWLLFNC
jgi:hypothetical protein